MSMSPRSVPGEVEGEPRTPGPSDEVLQGLRRVTETRPWDLKTWRRLADALRQVDDPEGELKAVETSLAIDPADAKIRGRLVTLLLRLGRANEVEPHLRILRGEEPPPAPLGAEPPPISPASVERRALRLLADGSPAAAERLYRRLVQESPETCGGWVGLRGALEAQGRAAEAQAVRHVWRAAAFDRESAIECGMARKLGGRGMVFDPRDMAPARPMSEVLDEASSVAELKSRSNVVLRLDPGGQVIEAHPILEFDGAGDRAVPVRYLAGARFVASIRNAAVVGDGLVLTEQGDLIEEINVPKAARFSAQRLPHHLLFDPEAYQEGAFEVRIFDQPALLMAGPTDNAFGDFLLNFVPRLGLAEAAELDCPILVRRPPQAQALDILKAVGVSLDRIVFHERGTVSLFPKLYVPSWPSRNKGAPMAGLFDIYERARRPRAAGPRPLLYLTRRDVAARPLTNEAEISDLFARRGFQMIDPGRLEFEQVRELFADPACVAGPFGSAFLNLVFCSGRPISLLLMPMHMPYYMTELAMWYAELGLRFAYVSGVTPPNSDSFRAPWTAPLDRVEQALDRVMKLVAQAAD